MRREILLRTLEEGLNSCFDRIHDGLELAKKPRSYTGGICDQSTGKEIAEAAGRKN